MLADRVEMLQSFGLTVADKLHVCLAALPVRFSVEEEEEDCCGWHKVRLLVHNKLCVLLLCSIATCCRCCGCGRSKCWCI